MKYTFTDDQLETIHTWMEVTPWVSVSYRAHMGLDRDAEVAVSDVEDFAIAFYTAYNQKHPGTY
jgi:hypothetical protein